MNNPNAKATGPQTFAIFCMAKYDVRKTALTKEQASNIIDRLKKGDATVISEIAALPGAEKKGEANVAPKQDYQAIWEKAYAIGIEAGKNVGVAPMVVNEHENPVTPNSPITKQYFVADGVCGFANVRIRNANSGFVRWLKKNNIGRSSWSGGWSINISEFNQSLQRKEACAYAIAAELKKHDIQAWGESRID